MTTVANVVYKLDIQCRIDFFLHLFSSVQNNQKSLAQPQFTSVILIFEFLVLVVVPAFLNLSLVFVIPRTPP